MEMCRAVKNLSYTTFTFPAEVKQGDALPSFSFHIKCPFGRLLSVNFFSASYFLFVILLFQTAPDYSAEVLCRVPKPKKSLMFLTEEVHV